MTFKPAHKQVGDVNKPGQLNFDRHPYLKSPNCEQDKSAVSETTLAHYIARKQRYDAFDAVAKEKKLTFDEWWAKPWYENHGMCDYHTAMLIWKAAQENV